MDKLKRFAIDYVTYVVKGSPAFYAWVAFLGLLILGLLYGTYLHTADGLRYTGLTDQVHDGLYLANFVFLVGIAAGAVTIVFPAYVYHHKGLHAVAVLGEMLAISAVLMCILFIVSHMGRPDRLWHMLPVIGIYNLPNSMLAWDTLVLIGYLFLNLIGGFYFLYKKYTGQPLNNKFYMPLIYVSIVWALSIHTVTAFLLNTMPSRPMWHHSMMPIRFILTAFAAGPSLIVLIFLIVRARTRLWIDNSAINQLATIITYCLGLSLFLSLSEVVTELYANTEHALGLQYLMFGMHGFNDLVPWFWGSLAASLGAFVILLTPGLRRDYRWLPIACSLAFAGIWVEKGMGLLVPGFIPTPIGEFSQYFPTTLEIVVTLGNWALGFLILTILLKGAIGILLGDIAYATSMQDRVTASDTGVSPTPELT
ncbi:sulfate reduction electron transfer complex DsrMKJOP subunit DsrP [Dechloromonas sp. HYN0024]|uniref:sulfate reduction electron transfer complex DsrMKJOP subunit DsrP n=1 Tax=Dechloromonas sp. HYN0024 TaxID=2231055 RepID=UPI000E447DC1|nr:NrfD/PsrC family molybdoenzyme membrane anchor subunit [Dechloromonas sp. HYN0024]AXS79545.1 polysulfide reductase [Dechloromonas sp. HYN0024]